MPCINTNHTHHISALLQNGDVITGQSQISHPSKQKLKRARQRRVGTPALSVYNNMSTDSLLGPDGVVYLQDQEPLSGDESASDDDGENDEEEYAYPGYIHPELKLSQLHFDKLDISEDQLLPAPIRRIFYINPYGEEVLPHGNSRAIGKLKNYDMIVYSVGSVVTSLLPIVILGNVAETIAENTHAIKVLLVNNKYDRETFGMNGAHIVQLIVESMNRAVHNQKRKRRTNKSESARETFGWSQFITDIVYLEQGEIPVDVNVLHSQGLRTHAIKSDSFDNQMLANVLNSLRSY